MSISKEELLREIRSLSDNPDEPPTAREMRECGEYSIPTYIDRWGSWNQAVQAAGFTPNTTKISTKELINELQRLANGPEVPPTTAEMKEQGKYSLWIYIDRWGSWNEALRAAGLSPNVEKNIPEEELINELHRLADNLENPPTDEIMREEGRYSPKPYMRRWGSWNEALQAAGLSPNVKKNIPEKELLGEIKRLAIELDHPPSKEEMIRYGEYSAYPYKMKFRSWWSAVVQAGLKPRARTPLCPEAIHRFHQTTLDQDPLRTLTGLIFQFTGITPEIFVNLSEDWVTELADEFIISVPEPYIQSNDLWEFRIPETWKNPYTGNREQTHLLGIVNWYFELHDVVETQANSTVSRDIYRIAREANLSDFRETITYPGLGCAPRVRPQDLWVTHGIALARNGAPKDFIERRLGLNHTNRQASIEDLFVWLEVNEDFQCSTET